MVEVTRRRAIEDAASDLFRRNGYTATSVRDIARALDMQGASLYAHVDSKEAVLWAIVDRVASRFEQAAEAAAGTSRDPVETLAALVRGHVTAVAADVGEAQVFVHEWRHLSPDRRALVLERRDAYEARFREAIAAGIAEGAFTMTESTVAATFILTACNGIPTWYRPDGPVLPADLADRYADMAVRSLMESSR